MARPSPTAVLRDLQRLADDPEAQARYAATLLATERRAQLVGPALVALEQLPLPEARPSLLRLYAHLDADGTRHDAGGTFRASILRALRPWATANDLPLLERAVTTYEFLPPGRSEEATPIRAAGLVALADLDPELAGFHAARLLVDIYTSRPSGEPAKTAAGVLAARSEHLALYLYTLRPTQHEDVAAECLRHLADAPDTIAREICARYGPEASEAAQLGLIDMLVARPDRALFHDELRARLRPPASLTVLRYLVVVMMASRRRELVDEVVATVEAEGDPQRLAVLIEALELLPNDGAIARALSVAQTRLQGR